VFASRLYEFSPLGACRQKHGELEAHILGATILSEMELIGRGLMSINELTWSIVDPSRYHRVVGLVAEKVAYLRNKGLLVGDTSDDVRLFGNVLPAPSAMTEWTTYLREADPITDEELKEATASM
jgi:hypothetical protein